MPNGAKQWAKWILGIGAGWAAIAALVFALGSCALVDTPGQYIEADVRAELAIAPVARRYVMADTTLSEGLRAAHLKVLDDWRAHVDDGASDPAGKFGRKYVEQDRAFYNAIAPWYVAYLKADPELDEDQLASLLDTVAAWELMIRQAEIELRKERGPPDE